jgi:lysozyme family protein
MADISNLIPLILKWERGYVNDPAYRGGPTNQGVTLSTWKAHGYDKTGDGIIDIEDLKQITPEEVINRILGPHYRDRWKADEIRSQALANILVDWVWGSGRYGIVLPQGILGVQPDGIVGPKTLNTLNSFPDQEALFNQMKQIRIAYFNLICSNRPANKRFLKGWLKRLNDFKWIPMFFFAGVLLLGAPVVIAGCVWIVKRAKS